MNRRQNTNANANTNTRISKRVPICDNMTLSTPKCPCGASVANCVIERCHQILSKDNSAPIRLEEWKRACLLEPDCQNQNDICEIQSIRYDEDAIRKHNSKQSRQPVSHSNRTPSHYKQIYGLNFRQDKVFQNFRNF